MGEMIGEHPLAQLGMILINYFTSIPNHFYDSLHYFAPRPNLHTPNKNQDRTWKSSYHPLPPIPKLNLETLWEM